MMIIVTTISSRAGSQALGEISHRLVDVFLWQFFPDGLQSDFQLINHLWLDTPVGSNLVIWGPIVLLSEPRTVRLQSVLCDACYVSWGTVLMKDEPLTVSVTAVPMVVT